MTHAELVLGWNLLNQLQIISKTTVSLTQAPVVSSKMRHVEQRHYYIRHLSHRLFLQLVYVSGSQMRANVLTKILPRGLYLQERSVLLNTVVAQTPVDAAVLPC